MSKNVSSTSNSSLSFTDISCLDFPFVFLTGTVYDIIRVTFILLCSIYILYVGHQRWRQQGSFAALSHTDIITFHMVGFEFLWIFGLSLYYSGHISNVLELIELGGYLCSVTYCGENFCHIVTCLERYLAVVYPITYMRIRKTSGDMIRNISMACVWLASFVCSWLLSVQYADHQTIIFVAYSVPSATVTFFCSFSILCVLNRPGPGAKRQDKERVDQSKEKAYQTIVGIVVVEALWFTSVVINYLIDLIAPVHSSDLCIVEITVWLFNLPSSLVLPLLYLHREGKLSCNCPNSG